MPTFISKSPAKTKRLAGKILRALAKPATWKQSLVLALRGDLGSGKTTFVQGLAKVLGVAGKIQSPTFILMKVYKLPGAGRRFKHFVHVDAYRLNGPKEAKGFGFNEALKNQNALVVIEWAERVKKLIPRGAVWIDFKHENKNVRRISLDRNAVLRKP